MNLCFSWCFSAVKNRLINRVQGYVPLPFIHTYIHKGAQLTVGTRVHAHACKFYLFQLQPKKPTLNAQTLFWHTRSYMADCNYHFAWRFIDRRIVRILPQVVKYFMHFSQANLAKFCSRWVKEKEPLKRYGQITMYSAWCSVYRKSAKNNICIYEKIMH